ncbi:uncharacterized protein BO97DRAFT_428588 [Aspergillus homomorphus CBS 101889]|uniref:Uncharacterized protein n=1 Tax=Aspergillus homomorphus (strain CBS 101889) TaxID=1450537 RepID=A0A395HKE7_ASPHC|nr:hypothetical protein BO97DRAFT_428588 [Aspergillus homomorphus CBS 101889]RAL08287.1 hypothetical protein BO97DRAFT_428588 [Aspergillus homomorphus CBS 101889]
MPSAKLPNKTDQDVGDRIPKLPRPWTETISPLDSTNLGVALVAFCQKSAVDPEHFRWVLQPDSRGIDPAFGARTLRTRSSVVSSESPVVHMCVPATHLQALGWALAKDEVDKVKVLTACGIEPLTPVFQGSMLLGTAILAEAKNVIRCLYQLYRRSPETKAHLTGLKNLTGRVVYRPLGLAAAMKNRGLMDLLLKLQGGLSERKDWVTDPLS